MNEWTKEQLEEMFGDDVIEKLAFLAGCTKHRLANDPEIPDGWIVPDDVLKKFAELIVQDCRDMFMVNSVSWNLLNEKLEHFGVAQ